MQIPSLKKRLLIVCSLLVLILSGLTFWLSGFLLDHFRDDIAKRNLTLTLAMAEHTENLMTRPVEELAKLLVVVEENKNNKGVVIQNELSDILRFNPFFILIQLLDTNGTITHVAPYSDEHIGLNMANHPFFKTAVKKGKPVWSDGFISSQTGSFSATVSIPFEHGVVIAQLNLDQLSSILQISAIGKGSFAAITDTRGVVIAHSNPEKVYKSINISNYSSVKRGLGGEHGSWDEIWDNQPGLASVTTIDMNNWVVIIFQPDSESKAVVNKVERLITIILVTAFGIAIFVFYQVLIQVLKPVRKLEKQSLLVAEGEYKEALEADYQELAAVIHNFNIMAEKVSLREQELIESEERFRRIFENSVVGFFQSTPEGKFIRVNRAFAKMLRYDSPEHLISTIQDIGTQYYVSPDDREEYKRILQQNGRIDGFEFKAQRKDGSEIWVSNSTRAYFDEQGIVIRYEGVVTDITDRRKAEMALLESEIRYRGIVEDNTEFIVRWQPDGLRTFVNRAYLKYLDKHSAGGLETNVYDYVHEDDKQQLEETISLLTPENPISYTQERKKFPGGEIVWQEWTERGVFDESGTLMEVQSVGRDITSLKVAEIERENAEQKLRQAHKMESVGTLAGGIAHDFNNILGIIIGNTELALDEVPDWNPAYENLHEIKTASFRARDVVKQLLSYSRKSKEELKPIDVVTVVRESLRLIRSSIPNSIEIRENIPGTTQPILADSTQIHQVFINLCTNAAHSMTDSKGTLEIAVDDVHFIRERSTAFDKIPSGDYVRLTVKDSGAGIEKELIDKIFDPYFTTKEVGKGTGMGLAVVHGIIKSHNAHIDLSSRPGQGTVVEVYFPATAEHADHRGKKEFETHSTGNETILFVDDEKALVDMIEQILTKLGYDIVAECDPAAALDLFASDPDRFDLVISDMTMPLMSGVELSEGIRKIRSSMPIIICTGHSSLIDEKKAENLGISAFVMKPVSSKKLSKTIRRVLEAGV